MLEARLKKHIGDLHIDAQLSVDAGVTVLFGPSGAGKSSILKMIAGLLEPDSGEISINGRKLFDKNKNVCVRDRGIGYVFQDGLLFPHMTVRQNLAFATDDEGHVAAVTEQMEITDLLARHPASLSGGERQRVAIARALASAPQCLLMDEPLANLDQSRKDVILPTLKRLKETAAVPIVYVTHSAEEAFRLSDRIVLIEDGKTSLDGRPEDVFGTIPDGANRNPLAGGLLSGTLVRHLPAEHLSELDVAGSAVFVAQTAHSPGTKVRVRLTASDISIATESPAGISILNRLPAQITGLVDRGRHGIGVSLQLTDGQKLVASVTERARTTLAIDVGSKVHALFKTVSVTPDDLD